MFHFQIWWAMLGYCFAGGAPSHLYWSKTGGEVPEIEEIGQKLAVERHQPMLQVLAMDQPAASLQLKPHCSSTFLVYHG